MDRQLAPARPGHLHPATGGTGQTGSNRVPTPPDIILAYLFIGLIFGLVNALVKPIVSLLSLPITILTLGLFTVVINAAMLYLTSWLSSYTPVHFTIDAFFWTAVLAAIIITVISLVADRLPGAGATADTRRRSRGRWPGFRRRDRRRVAAVGRARAARAPGPAPGEPGVVPLARSASPWRRRGTHYRRRARRWRPQRRVPARGDCPRLPLHSCRACARGRGRSR